MPIQFPDFQRISFDEANPWLVGAERGQKFAQSAMQFPQDLQSKILANQIAQVQAKYAEPMAQQSLTAAQLQNQWNPKIWQSEIGLRGAQTGLTNQQAQWYGKDTQSQIGLRNAQAQQASVSAQQDMLKLNYLKQILAGQSLPGGGAPAGGGQAPAQQGMQPQGGGAPMGQPQGAPQMGGGSPMAQGGASPQQAPQAQGGAPQQPPMQQPAYTPPTTYGIPTPQPTQQDIANKMLLGMDTFTPKLENAKVQQQDQYKQYQQAMVDSIQNAGVAAKMKNLLSLFNNAMNNSTYRGSTLGSIPSKGWTTGFTPGDLSNEQTADTMASQLLPSAITELREAMKSGQFSVADLNAASNMKVNRTMDDQTRNTQTQWLNGVWNRMEERAKFYTMMGNPQSGAQKAQADMLWQNYQEQNPLISADGKTYLGSSLGNWPLYTSPKAIASVQATGTYKPTAAAKNAYWMQLPPDKDHPQGWIAPIKKGQIEQALIAGGKPV